MNINLRKIQERKKTEMSNEIAAKIWVMSAKRMYLRWVHFLRFNENTRFKKRLIALIDEFGGVSERTAELQKDHVLASVMLKELKDWGIDLTDFFEDLIEYEETEYQIDRDKEHGKRCAGK
jgi:hypothetical protein